MLASVQADEMSGLTSDLSVGSTHIVFLSSWQKKKSLSSCLVEEAQVEKASGERLSAY